MLQAIHHRPVVSLKPDQAPRGWRYHSAPEDIILGRKGDPGPVQGFHYDHDYRLTGVTKGLATGIDGEDFVDDGSIGMSQQESWTPFYRYDSDQSPNGPGSDWSERVERTQPPRFARWLPRPGGHHLQFAHDPYYPRLVPTALPQGVGEQIGATLRRRRQHRPAAPRQLAQ